jgi:hypothetical protein
MDYLAAERHCALYFEALSTKEEQVGSHKLVTRFARHVITSHVIVCTLSSISFCAALICH